MLALGATPRVVTIAKGKNITSIKGWMNSWQNINRKVITERSVTHFCQTPQTKRSWLPLSSPPALTTMETFTIKTNGVWHKAWTAPPKSNTAELLAVLLIYPWRLWHHTAGTTTDHANPSGTWRTPFIQTTSKPHEIAQFFWFETNGGSMR